jgi:hypothetical protein
MRIHHTIAIVLIAAAALMAQRHELTINAETPEGQALQQIGQEADAQKKAALMEEFAQKNPKHEGTPWVLEQLVSHHLKASDFDKALSAGERLLALDPGDTATAHNCLKAAEGKKDPDLVMKWAAQTSALARKDAAQPEPAGADEKEDWKKGVDYAKQVDTYTEYALYAAALGATDPAKKLALGDALQKQNPNSQYLAQLNDQLFLALRQSGQNDKAVELAEKVLEKNQTNEDMLLVVADKYMNAKKDPDKVIALSNRLVEVMGSKPKPEGVSDGDWTKRKNLMMGLGHWMAGMTYLSQKKTKEMDTSLRAALPFIEDNPQLAAPALFQLGLANYQMGAATKNKKLLADALAFNRKCAAIKSQYSGQAAKNAQVISQQFGIK